MKVVNFFLSSFWTHQQGYASLEEREVFDNALTSLRIIKVREGKDPIAVFTTPSLTPGDHGILMAFPDHLNLYFHLYSSLESAEL